MSAADAIGRVREAIDEHYGFAGRREDVVVLLAAYDEASADADRLRGQLGTAVDAHEDALLAVWRALGIGHAPPLDLAENMAAIVSAIQALRSAKGGAK